MLAMQLVDDGCTFAREAEQEEPFRGEASKEGTWEVPEGGEQIVKKNLRFVSLVRLLAGTDMSLAGKCHLAVARRVIVACGQPWIAVTLTSMRPFTAKASRIPTPIWKAVTSSHFVGRFHCLLRSVNLSMAS